MASKLKYDLESLEWDDEHNRNKEGTYCYCGMDYSEGDPMLRCGECKQLFHWDCVSCLKIKPLRGDCFYKFTCKICNGGEDEQYERDVVSWVQVIYLVLYHLIKSDPDKKYFRWRENICATIGEHWDGLFPGKAKTATWHNTVAGSLSTHSLLFKSGFEETQQTGNWTLHQAAEPAKARFRGPTKARDSDKPAAKRERARKKDGASASAKRVTDAEKEILEVLNESKAAGKQRRGAVRHHVSFSDDEDEDEDTIAQGTVSKRARTKKRRTEAKTVEVDDDLIQSFAIYSKMEKQRLDQQDEPSTAMTTAPAGASTSNVESKDAVVPATGSKEDDEDDERPSESETKSTDVVELLDGCYLGEDTESISSLSSWSTDAGLEETLDTSREPLKLLSTTVSGKHSQTNDAEKRMEHLPKDGPDGMPGSDANDVDKVRDAVDSSEAMEVDDVALKSPCIGREAGGFGWTRLLDDEENGKMDSDDALEYTVSSKQQSSAAADAQPAMLSERAQWDVSACINSSKVAMSDPQARRLYRRLQLRRFKRMLGLQSFDIDSTVKECMRRRQRVWSTRDEDSRNVAGDMTMPSSDNREMMLAGTTASIEGHEDGYQQDISSIHDVSGESSRAGSLGMQGQSVSGALGGAQSSDDAAKNMKESGELVSVTPYVHSFASRLLGRAVLRDSLTSPVARVSPYHGRLLRPFIWRDWIKTDNSERASDVLEPAMLWMHRSIRSRQHKVFGKLEFVREDNICEALNGGESIDYVYFQEEHVDQVNALLSRTFWSGVDVREALMYPEFTVVALYKRLVIGCAFLTPDAYLTYIAVSSGWAGAGIAKFMLYHLTQTVPTKDVTLHVSANNAAMVLYQQFGFKPEKYVVNFYKSYLPESSRLSANAFFMRLRRY